MKTAFWNKLVCLCVRRGCIFKCRSLADGEIPHGAPGEVRFSPSRGCQSLPWVPTAPVVAQNEIFTLHLYCVCVYIASVCIPVIWHASTPLTHLHKCVFESWMSRAMCILVSRVDESRGENPEPCTAVPVSYEGPSPWTFCFLTGYGRVGVAPVESDCFLFVANMFRFLCLDL